MSDDVAKQPPVDRATVESTFYAQFGRTMAAWGYVESTLCTFFERLTQMYPPLARRIYYSPAGFDGRVRMLNATLDVVRTEPNVSDFLRKAVGKARNYAGSRNKIAHGDALYIEVEGSKYRNQMIVLEGRSHWRMDIPPEDVITISNLEIAYDNFGRLAALLLAALNFDGSSPDLSPTKLQELVPVLPTTAHMDRLDPTSAARFQFGKESLLHWR